MPLVCGQCPSTTTIEKDCKGTCVKNQYIAAKEICGECIGKKESLANFGGKIYTQKTLCIVIISKLMTAAKK